MAETERQRKQRLIRLEEVRQTVRDGATCPTCGAPRGERCDSGGRTRNHQARKDLFERYERERLAEEQAAR